MQSRFAVAFAVSLPLLAPALAQAGPPLICWPMSIGNAPSLPWGGGWHDTRPDYDGRGRLATDTLALLGSDTPVLVRMETLRRAAVYAASDDAAAGRLFQALRAQCQIEAGLERVPARSPESFREAFGVAMIAAGADLRAARDWIPRRVCPLYRRRFCHERLVEHIVNTL